MTQSTLKHHEELIDKHEVKLEDIQQDLVDIKTAMGIKDLTNGQVVDHQKRLAKAIDDEKAERKEQDKILREDLRGIRTVTWGIMTAVLFAIALEILSIVGGSIL